jgi:hypothetical protein
MRRSGCHSDIVLRHVPFPFPGGEFPAELGVVVQRTVLTGERPAREVIHAPDGSWLVGDGEADPNVLGASIAAHMSHVVAYNSSVAELAGMPPGHWAHRESAGQPSVITELVEWED